MGRVTPKKRKTTIRQNQKRQQQLKALRNKYVAASGALEKEKIWEKAVRLAPQLTKEEFLAPAKQAS